MSFWYRLAGLKSLFKALCFPLYGWATGGRVEDVEFAAEVI